MSKTYSTDELAERLGVSRQTLYRWVRDHGCPVFQPFPGAKMRFDLDKVEAWRKRNGGN